MNARERCIQELAQWFVKHRRHMTMKEMRPIVAKHFPQEAEATRFCRYLTSKRGQAAFRERLKEEKERR